jgi:hypothetical protein
VVKQLFAKTAKMKDAKIFFTPQSIRTGYNWWIWIKMVKWRLANGK